MDAFATEPAKIRAEVFIETAARMNVRPAIVEKDFWVCWTLKRTVSLGDRIPGLIFKGGTSLSKAYGLIRRFSEDIDLSLDRHDLGFTGERDPALTLSGGKVRKALLDELEKMASAAVAGPVKTGLMAVMAEALGKAPDLELAENESQTLIFTYPASLPATASLPYVRPSVRLELGARSDHLPSEQRDVHPYIHAQFPDLLKAPKVTVKTLSAERTFWEKATILHMLHHMGPGKPLGDRMSRHYYDLAQLAGTEVRSKALNDLSLLNAVATHKSIFFRAAWANYGTARPPTLRLSPGEELKRVLKPDYASMSEMLFDEAEPFEDLLAKLGALERQINELA